ncbi:hypothetical protein U14_02566 [Candidatus Moduliflexus flocculans]|uniref:Uncharacterized protein n=1 Tax=Candidatus Moduliflexus flocculans TaxID=1499966 RepID=A0A081BLQ7_9BACT|nr:hypothetical protein U14_02566 [Candidatus Moduliflexus flocculans]
MTLLFIGLSGMFFFVSGCAGPLDTAIKEGLKTSYIGKTYIAKTYLGSRYALQYSNNNPAMRSPVGVFTDASGRVWYKNDASFFEAGQMGGEVELRVLQYIDRDLNYDSFAQGIQAGQLVTIAGIEDKSDQIVLETQTLASHSASKTYDVSVNGAEALRASRIHLLLGKEQMQALDPASLDPLLAQLLEPAPILLSEQQNTEYILANYRVVPLADLAKLTSRTTAQVRETMYAFLLSMSSLPVEAQQRLTAACVEMGEELAEKYLMRLENIRISDEKGQTVLHIDIGLQDFANLTYDSVELRAGLLFFNGAVNVAAKLALAVFTGNPAFNLQDIEPHLGTIVVRYSYLYFNQDGKRSMESASSGIPLSALYEYLLDNIDAQQLAAASRILVDNKPVTVSASDIKAIEEKEPKSWKRAQVVVEKGWKAEYQTKTQETIVTGSVKNIGNWIAKNIRVSAVGKQGKEDVSKQTTTLSGLVRPGELKSFTLILSAKTPIEQIDVKILDFEEVK